MPRKAHSDPPIPRTVQVPTSIWKALLRHYGRDTHRGRVIQYGAFTALVVRLLRQHLRVLGEDV